MTSPSPATGREVRLQTLADPQFFHSKFFSVVKIVSMRGCTIGVSPVLRHRASAAEGEEQSACLFGGNDDPPPLFADTPDVTGCQNRAHRGKRASLQAKSD